MAAECIFCKIARQEIPAEILYEDEEIIVFPDIQPKYKVHILLIPKKHLTSVSEATDADDAVLGRILRIGARIAEEKGIASGGFRLLTNTGSNAGQVVSHLHVHLLGGERLNKL